MAAADSPDAAADSGVAADTHALSADCPDVAADAHALVADCPDLADPAADNPRGGLVDRLGSSASLIGRRQKLCQMFMDRN